VLLSEHRIGSMYDAELILKGVHKTRDTKRSMYGGPDVRRCDSKGIAPEFVCYRVGDGSGDPGYDSK
jgi:hypothetical protein